MKKKLTLHSLESLISVFVATFILVLHETRSVLDALAELVSSIYTRQWWIIRSIKLGGRWWCLPVTFKNWIVLSKFIFLNLISMMWMNLLSNTFTLCLRSYTRWWRQLNPSSLLSYTNWWGRSSYLLKCWAQGNAPHKTPTNWPVPTLWYFLLDFA